jgi:hypothetical protein
MKPGFVPISLEEYIELQLKSNPNTCREEITVALKDALENYERGVKSPSCGNPIGVIGSALAANMCVNCITGEANPEDDYKFDEACY